MYELIERCIAGNAKAWTKLRQLYDDVARQPVSRLLTWAGFDPNAADDVAQEIFMRLCDRSFARLRRFRGTTELEVKSWIVKIAVNFTHSWIDKNWKDKKRERNLRQSTTEPDRSGPTEAEVASFLEDLKDVLSDADVGHLRILAGFEPGEKHKSKGRCSCGVSSSWTSCAKNGMMMEVKKICDWIARRTAFFRP